MSEKDLSITIGMDFACQWWLTDHRGRALPVDRPARITVVDNLSQQLFDCETMGEADPEGHDPLLEPLLMASPVNGMLQLSLPRGLTAQWDPGRLSYDIWATVFDDDVLGLFPAGQQLPVARGQFYVRPRITQMEAE